MKKLYERDKVNIFKDLFIRAYGKHHYIKIDTDSPDRHFNSDWDCLIVAGKTVMFFEAKDLKDGRLRPSDLSATQALAREDILAGGGIHHIVAFHKNSDEVTIEDEDRIVRNFPTIKTYVAFLLIKYFNK